jgi:tetraacyldisaccharide 4'-kinase
MSGREKGARAALLRGALAAAEPLYAAAAVTRNWLFDSAIRKSHRLPRPVISVGNLTTGGTGKTPVVRWLAERLADAGRRVAVIARGYGARQGELNDELLMLRRLLNEGGTRRDVALAAHPDRVAAGRRLLAERPEVDTILLDDGFQHRRLARDLDIVLLSAANPYGYDHLLPRGMLREPVRGLARAGAVILTHADQSSGHQLSAQERRVQGYNEATPVYRAVHAPSCLRVGDDERPRPLDELRGRRWLAVSGIADPRTFVRHLGSMGGFFAGHRAFPDHHRYTGADLAAVQREAIATGAEVILTTEKDWAKLRTLAGAVEANPPIWRVDVGIQFLGDGEEQRLWEQVWRVVQGHG